MTIRDLSVETAYGAGVTGKVAEVTDLHLRRTYTETGWKYLWEIHVDVWWSLAAAAAGMVPVQTYVFTWEGDVGAIPLTQAQLDAIRTTAYTHIMTDTQHGDPSPFDGGTVHLD
jgi:hypothetical protein